LGVDAEARPAREPAVVGIALAQLARHARRLPVRRRGQDQSLELLHAPAARDELEREPVEELGMRRALALRAEVLARRDEPAPEDALPRAVDEDARRQRVRR